jgi:Putative DNA-binding domain
VPKSFVNLNLNNVTEAVLRELIAEGETNLVERKEKLPKDGLGPTVASFANSGGGWILLGVADDGTPVGFAAPGRAEPKDWLRNLLRKDLDPLPLCEADSVTIDGVDVLVIRVQASALTPHVYLPGGAIYIREHGGRHPVKSQAELITLATSPEQAKENAIRRMMTLPLVLRELGSHDLGSALNGQTRVADWTVTAGPLMVPDAFRKRALSEAIVKAARTRLSEQLDKLGPSQHARTEVHPDGLGVLIVGRNHASGDELHLLLDGGGVAVGRMRLRLTRGVCHPGTMADDIITPLLMLTLGSLADCGVVGMTHLHLYVRITPTEKGWRPILMLATAHDTGELHAPPNRELLFDEDIELPAELEDTKATAEIWMREISRTAGIGWWEPESS